MPLRARRAWRKRRAWRIVHVLIALVVAAAVLGVLGFGYGTIPPLGAALDPARGAWTSAAGGNLPHDQTLRIAGLDHPVSVSFSAQGVPSIRAASQHDLSLALGYVQATFRLSEMDLERRLGEGRLSQLAGSVDIPSDKFELQLGLLRTAQQEWADTPRASQAGQALLGFSQGVNDYLAQVRKDGDWPALFSLSGVYPGPWTPVDSLVIQGVLTQELDFTTTPLDYALLERSLGPAATMAWFPVLPQGQQSPYDPGPYCNQGLAPLNASGRVVTTAKTKTTTPQPVSAATATAAATLLTATDELPAGLIHRNPDSNAWAANGPAVAGGGALLAGDPHLPQTLPSLWYQVALSAPGIDLSGVAVPGLPTILIGHNAHIAWSLTDTQNQAAFFYTERTSPAHPDEYFWRGAWRKMRFAHYTIPVRGGSPVRLTVKITVHGPIMTQAGQTVSVDWMGDVPSPDLAAMEGVSQATDFAQFRAALASWRAPTQNFVYADTQGNIGAISAGYYPQVAHGDPWLPMPGTGADDIAGVIPYAAVPQVYDPPQHVVATANQRPVGPSYPYYIGTSANFFDPSYRANEIYATLRGQQPLSTASFAALQGNVTDQLATQIVPALLSALHATPAATTAQRQAENLLTHWNDQMTAGSAAASLWWTFWGDYVSAVFQPWWTHAKVPVRKDSLGLSVSAGQFSLDEDLAAWTLHDPANHVFSPPGRAARTAPQVMRSAFGQAVAHLATQLGGRPADWTWGRLHSKQFPSLLPPAALGYGPRAAGGDPWTVDAAEGGMTSTVGPSWRMIARLTASGVSAEGVYPGGQSENPASPWYTTFIADWWDGRYRPMPTAATPASKTKTTRWALQP
ncbi:MAG TPA: penicillin acylase family protein [Streptosporangiaceae bacterium]|jgi:penicillin amidase